jgi:phosphoribosylglycinamide formyltransferase-1
MQMKRIAILASGNGTNAQRIIDHFKESTQASVDWVISNKQDAYVLKRAADAGVENLFVPADRLKDGAQFVKMLSEHHIDLVVLAGYLLLIPKEVIQHFSQRILNIHPALLPAYGGRGMYGEHVHRAVIADKQKESGITIHYVNEHYDEGAIIFQARCPVLPDDTPESLAQRIHELEHAHYPKIIEQVLSWKS